MLFLTTSTFLLLLGSLVLLLRSHWHWGRFRNLHHGLGGWVSGWCWGKHGVTGWELVRGSSCICVCRCCSILESCGSGWCSSISHWSCSVCDWRCLLVRDFWCSCICHWGGRINRFCWLCECHGARWSSSIRCRILHCW